MEHINIGHNEIRENHMRHVLKNMKVARAKSTEEKISKDRKQNLANYIQRGEFKSFDYIIFQYFLYSLFST